ncbi:MAG: DUF2219 family protein [Caulobacteraceae bacterium]|nr:DUF2219 family protein [Caulobacteraceae bacterium]
MRIAAGLLLMIAGAALAPCAQAQTAAGGSGAAALFQAVFAASNNLQSPWRGSVTSAAGPAQPGVGPSGAFVLPGPDSLIIDSQTASRRYVHHWPSAFSVSAGGYDLALSPQAGVGVGEGGSSAEAGATLSLGAKLRQTVVDGLDRFGVREADSAELKDRGRWFVFAAASGSAVGLNIARDAQGRYQRLGWSAEGASALVSDASAGVAWRKGATQASLGYVRRDIRADFGDGVASGHFSDSMVAFSISIHP